jgi:hypothetical protein
MSFEQVNKRMQALIETVREGVNLPSHVFEVNFSNYLFFDNDICTCSELKRVLQQVIKGMALSNTKAAVFSSSDRSYRGTLSLKDDWDDRIFELSKEMNDAGDFGGLIIVDSNKQWALFQMTPVDEGVLGINNNQWPGELNESIKDNFIDCEIINSWLEEKSKREQDLVKYLGRDFLMHMINNYSSIRK